MKIIEILKEINQIKTVDDLLNNFDCVIEITKDDVRRIAISKRLLFSDFDFAYADAAKMLKSQLKKSHLKGISGFLKCENISNAVSWLITRILGNMRNITTNKKYKLYCAPCFGQLHENIEKNDELDTMIELMDLEKFDKDTLKKGLQTIWENSKFDLDFDFQDLKYLCAKFDFNVDEIIVDNINSLKFKKEQAESGNFQLIFVF